MSSKEEEEITKESNDDDVSKQQEEKDAAVVEAVKPPEGVLCKWITPDNSVRLGLKREGDGGSFVEYKTFTMEFVKDHVQNFSSFSEFKDVLPLLKEYPEDQDVLVSVDETKKYGEKFLFYYTISAKKKYFEEREALLRKKEEELRLQKEEEERIRKQEEAERNAVWKPKDLVASKTLPEPSESTLEEMSTISIESSRTRIRLVASAKRKDIEKPYTFADHDGQTKEFRSKMDPNFELKRKIVDLGLQDGPSLFTHHEDVGTQTVSFPKTNMTTSTDAQILSQSDVKRVTRTLGFAEFLDRCTLQVEMALQQNETADMYRNDLESLCPGESLIVEETNDSNMKPLRSFTHLQYSKGKRVTSVDWHPTRRGVAVVSCAENMSFDSRCEFSGQATYSYNLIWNFRDLLRPERVLRSPFETNICRFNPDQPKFVAGGLMTGQVVVWNCEQHDENKNSSSDVRHQVEPNLISSIEHSHHRTLTDLHWLPADMQVDATGKIHRENLTNQFVTCSLDGRILFWDMRHRKRLVRPSKTGQGKIEETMWTPIYSVAIGTQHKSVKGDGLTNILLVMQSSVFIATTEEGQLVFGDWNGVGQHSSNSSKVSTDSKGGENEVVQETSVLERDEKSGKKQVIKSAYFDHVRPATTLQRSPFYDDIILSVGTQSFNIWKEGLVDPIFRSPNASCSIECSSWSSSRPGVIFVGKSDGEIDIWDLLSTSHKPRAVIQVGSSAVTAIQIWKGMDVERGNQEFLAAGDAFGSLHIFDMPTHLEKMLDNEIEIMRQYLDREAKAAQYARKMRKDAKRKMSTKIVKDEGVVDEFDKKVLEERESEYLKIEKRFMDLFKVASSSISGGGKSGVRESKSGH